MISYLQNVMLEILINVAAFILGLIVMAEYFRIKKGRYEAQIKWRATNRLKGRYL